MKCWSDEQSIACKLFFSMVKFEFRSFQFYRCLQWFLYYIIVFVSCILDFLLHDVMQREVDNNEWPTASFIIDCQLASKLVDDNISRGDNFYLKPIIF